MTSEYEDFIKTTDLKVDAQDDLQFYLDGYDEEHGEIHGVIKRMRRGDYNELLSEDVTGALINEGLKYTLNKFDVCRQDLLKEIGDEHWYLTRFLQTIGITWDQVEKLNTLKLVERVKKNMIIGSGSNREE